MTDPASYFASSYAEARTRFRDAAQGAGAALESVAHPSRGPEGEALATDVAWIGPRDAERLLLTISATHGIEGYCGSGVQSGSLEAKRYGDLPPGLAVMMIHAINPYGFAWSRRVTEDNVDLNRNFADFAEPLPENPGYADLHEVICPPSWDPETIESTVADLLGYAGTHSMAALQQAVSGGQYAYADGLFYGGRGPTWSHATLDGLLRQHCGKARKIAVIDYHTGLGPFGYGERICPAQTGTPERGRALEWFTDITSPDDGSSSSAPLVGTNHHGIQRALAHAEVTQIALEYGTQPLLEVINSLRGDNWLHVHGDPVSSAARPIKSEIRRCFYPGTPDWCRSVWDRAVETENLALGALAES